MALVSQAFKDRVLEKLTDGSYQKVQGLLVDVLEPSKRCCLGVMRQVASELGILPSITDQQLYDREGGQYLSDSEGEAIGLLRQEQRKFAKDNDSNMVPEGMFYPQEVIDRWKSMPVKEQA